MKRILLIVSLVFYFPLVAQEYIPMLEDGNKWGVQTCFFGDCEDVFITQIIGEEIINGKTYKVVNGENCLVREENGVVYVLNEDLSEDVLLDFTLEIGDSFFIENILDNCLTLDFAEDRDELRVVAIDTQFILGEDRKVLYMDYYKDGVQFDLGGEEEIWIEGIGSTAAIGPAGIVIDIEVRLRCFTNNGETINISGNDIFDTEDECEGTTAGVDKFLINQISLSPIPVAETAIVTIPLEIQEARIVVFDVNGRHLFEEPVSAKNTLLDFSSMTNGLYFYQIYSKNKLLVTKKLLVR